MTEMFCAQAATTFSVLCEKNKNCLQSNMSVKRGCIDLAPRNSRCWILN